LELLRQHSRSGEGDFDQCPIANFAGYAKAGVIGFDESFGYWQAKAGSARAPVR
jgi:hypothetical protein